MREICFEMPNGLEKEDWKAFYHVYYCINPHKRMLVLFLRILNGVLCILMGLMTLLMPQLESGSLPMAVVTLALCLFTGAFSFGYQALTVRRSMRSMRDLPGGGEPTAVILREDGMIDRSPSATTRYEYGGVYKLCYCRNTFVIFLNKKVALLLPERYRTGVSSTELKQFLEEKTGKTLESIK